MPATDLEKLVVSLAADIRSYERSLARANGVTNRQFSAIERRAQAMNSRLNSIGRSAANNLIAPLSGLGAALGVREIANYADAWTEAGNKLSAAAQAAGVQTRSLNELKDGANSARTGVEAYVDLYAKLIRSASGVAKSEEEIALATNIVSKAFKAGGASAAEQAAGILQLGQALGSGVLQGDELRSLRENAPIIAQAIADEFGTTIAGLKQLGADGELVSSRIFRAIINAQKPIEAQFKATNATIKDAIAQVNNEFMAYIGNADGSAGASQKLVEALQYLAANFTEVGNVIIQFATLLIGALTGRAIVGMIGGLGNAVVALGAFLTAVRAGALGAAGFTAALGPIGLLAGAAAAALFLYSDGLSEADAAARDAQSAIEANAAALDLAKASSEGYTGALRNQIAMQQQAARAAFELAYAEAKAAKSRADTFRTMTKALTGTEMSFDPLDYAAKKADEDAVRIGLAAFNLGEQLKEIDANMKSVDSGFGGGVNTGVGGTGRSAKTDEYAREIEQIINRTAANRAETEALREVNPLIDDYGFALERARARQDLLTAAKEAGKTVTPELAAEIDKLSIAYANSVVGAERLAESQDKIKQRAEEMRDFQKDVTRGIVDGFIQGKEAADIFADALSNIGNKLLDIAFDAAFSGGGFLSGILGGGAKVDSWTGMRSVGVPGRVNGGPVSAGKPYIVGEERPELFVPGSSGRIIPQVPTMPSLAGMSWGSSVVHVSFAPSYNVTGTGEEIAALRRQMAKDRAEFPSRAVAEIQKAQKKGVKV